MENDELELDHENEDGEEEKKPKLTPEQLQGIKKRQFTKLAKELGIDIPKHEVVEKDEPVEKTEFGLDEINFLGLKGVPEEDFPYVLQELKDTGKRLQDLVKLKYLQDELKTRAEDRKTVEALPSSARTGSIGRDSVDYWLARGTLPPLEQVDLRRKVVEAKMKREEHRSHFTDNPLV